MVTAAVVVPLENLLYSRFRQPIEQAPFSKPPVTVASAYFDSKQQALDRRHGNPNSNLEDAPSPKVTSSPRA
jgi:hypothetical protein